MTFRRNRRPILGALSTIVVAFGCGASNSCPPEPDASAPAEVIPGTTIPWSDVQIRYLGLTDLGVPGGPDVELRWEVLHEALGSSEDLSAVPISGSMQNADVVGMVIEREPTRTLFRVRVGRPAVGAGSVVSTTIGLRLLFTRGRARTFWEVAPRMVSIDDPAPGVPRSRDFPADGRIEIEIVEAPDVPTRADAWVMRRGRSYSITYRVHNRTDVSQRVRITAWVLGASRLDERSAIGAGEHLEVSLPMTPTDLGECGFYDPDCHYLAAQIEGETSTVDMVHRSVLVVP